MKTYQSFDEKGKMALRRLFEGGLDESVEIECDRCLLYVGTGNYNDWTYRSDNVGSYRLTGRFVEGRVLYKLENGGHTLKFRDREGDLNIYDGASKTSIQIPVDTDENSLLTFEGVSRVTI